MEFVSDSEVLELLKEQGITRSPSDGDRIHLEMTSGAEVVRVRFTTGAEPGPAPDAERVIRVEAERLAGTVDSVINKLHLRQVLLIPVNRWRHVFDAVAFSLAENEDWQEFDAAATVELNTRDPLLCEPADFQIVSALVRALLNDADSPDQGLMMTSPAAPLLVEVAPVGSIRVCVGTQVMADQLAEAFATERPTT